LYLVRVRVTFSAAHRLFLEHLSDEENYALYGKCSNPNGHGHNYDLEVTVAGEVDPATGMVVNFHDINTAVDRCIFDKVDHRNLNCDVDFMRGVIPTAENMAAKFWEILEPEIKNGRLFSITLSERNANVVTYFGPGTPAEMKERIVR
jgi:6-pyruvoyltetrahydropterin/6-carboxytetrahydropterin synthase